MKMLNLLALTTMMMGAGHAKSAPIKELEIMSYNVENLFDDQHDSEHGKEKDDWTFLPKNYPGKELACKKVGNPSYRKECFGTDWSKRRLEMKLQQIVRVFKEGRKNIPDMVALVEVENEAVVGMLAKVAGYQHYVVSKGADERGIDVALMYNESEQLKKVGQQELVLEGEYFKDKPTRPILEVEFLVNGKEPLTIFVNHWPSLSNPTETRIIAAQKLKQRVDELLKKNDKHLIMAMGDFNTIPDNYPHPFNSVLLADNKLVDLHQKFMDSRAIDKKQKQRMPPGSYFYYTNMAWNLLDHMFLSQNLMDDKGSEVELDSYQIYAPAFLQTEFVYKHKGDYLKGTVIKGVPRTYDFEANKASEAGFSDHFPLLARLRF